MNRCIEVWRGSGHKRETRVYERETTGYEPREREGQQVMSTRERTGHERARERETTGYEVLTLRTLQKVTRPLQQVMR